ncbi:MAG: Holliday junction branch migration protein RuvA [Gemmatimonadales bacterium]|nr:Holliday junction branch migration protein RuvA [Gemmatimonadales bacterium]
MLAFLDGKLVSGGTEAVVLIGDGLGLDVQLSAFSAEQLPVPGESVHLWTHLAVREDHWSLYGFISKDERAMFRLLITVSGIGPKVAMGILSKAPAAELAQHLRAGDEKALTRFPGVGKKSAARLVVELGQRVPELAESGLGSGGGPEKGTNGGLAEALSVLSAMGMGPGPAEQALLRARQNDPGVVEDLEKWVRAALRVI